jgi:hypothetical protein
MERKPFRNSTMVAPSSCSRRAMSYARMKGYCAGLVDAAGRQIPSVFAYQVDQRRAESAASRQREDEDALLITMHQAPDRTLAGWAEALGWTSPTTGEALRARVHRTLDRLKAEKMVAQKRGRWTLTGSGKNEAEKLEDQAA